MSLDNSIQKQIYFEMNNIKKSFGDLQVLNDISLSVSEGDVLSIIGPSGSGKSTLLRIATMLETMDYGDMSYMGEKAVEYRAYHGLSTPDLQSKDT